MKENLSSPEYLLVFKSAVNGITLLVSDKITVPKHNTMVWLNYSEKKEWANVRSGILLYTHVILQL